jgi:hypothetical protein
VQPAVLDITIRQRATFRQHFNLPIDMTGYEVAAQVWSEKRRGKIIEFDIEWTDQANGEFDLVASYTQTEKFTKDGEWDLMLIYPNNERHYWIEGKAIFDPGYTDPDD